MERKKIELIECIACVASVSVGFGSKEDFWCFSRAKNGASSRTIFRAGKTLKIPFL